MLPEARLGVVNGLRGIAILGVLWHHVAAKPAGWHAIDVGGLPIPWAALLSNAWLGVNLFFVLSGFVLFLPYARGARQMESTSDAIGFLRRRAKRLLPLYYVSSIVILLAARSGWLPRLVVPSDVEMVLVATITYGFTKAYYAPQLNPPLWSLAIEVWFSIAFPILAILARRAGIVRFVVVVALVALAARFVGVSSPIFERAHNPYLNPMKDGLLGRLDDFATGMGLAVLWVRRSSLFSEKRAAPLLLAGVILVASSAAAWDLHVMGRIPRVVVPVFDVVTDVGLFALTAGAMASAGFARTILRSAVLQIPGKMCFSIYVWHGALNRSILLPGWGLGRFAIFAVVLAGLSSLTYRFLEFGHVRDWRSLFRADP